MKKYELVTEDYTTINGRTLYRIKALKSFGNVSLGDLGGYIEKEANLSHDGDCWVYGNANVHGNAIVYGNAHVSENAHVYGNAHVSENAIVHGKAIVYGNAHVSENAHVYGNAHVSGNAIVYGNAVVYEKARVCDNSRIFGNARVFGDAHVFGVSNICGNANVQKAYQQVTILGIKHTITVAPNMINIGCITWDTLEEFKKYYKIIGKKNNYTPDEIKIIYKLVTTLVSRLEKI